MNSLLPPISLLPNPLSVSQMWRLLLTSVCVLCTSIVGLQASDGLAVSFKLDRSYYMAGENIDADITIRNDNVLTMDRFSLRLWAKYKLTNEVVYTRTVSDSGLPPFTNRQYKLSYNWNNQLLGTYSLGYTIDFEFDIDTTNNSKSADADIIMGRDSAIRIANAYIWQPHTPPLDFGLLRGYMDTQTWDKGTHLSSTDTTGLSFNLPQRSWVAYIDHDIYSMYTHRSSVLVIDAFGKAPLQSFPISWRLRANDSVFAPDPFDSSQRFFGDAPSMMIADTQTVANASTTSVPADSTCAILISGLGQDPADQAGLNNNTTRFKVELTSDSLGPRLPLTNVVQLRNATGESILSAVEALKGKYKKLYFFYSGHCDTAGNASLQGGDQLNYESLFELLYDSEVPELCVVIESCYSGTAIRAAQQDERYRDRNITLLTSSAADKVSKKHIDTVRNGYVTYGEFTLALTKCMGESRAESDGIPGISLAEAYNWMRQQNPVLQTGGRLDSVMDPQRWIHRRTTTSSTSNISFPDADIEFVQRTPFSSSAQLSVQLRSDRFSTTPAEQNVREISDARYWSIHLANQMGDFSTDVQFNFRKLFDDVDTTGGTLGLVSRSSGAAMWKAHTPTVWDQTRHLLTAQLVSSFSDWAIA